MALNQVAFIDCETTGLDPDRHEIWELALIVGGVGERWLFRPNLRVADPGALRLNRFYQRLDEGPWVYPHEVAERIATLVDGRHLVGANPAFDAAFLERFLRKAGEASSWHYHLIDVEVLMLGYLAGNGIDAPVPWKSDDLARKIGVNPDLFDRHTASGDARWAEAIYKTVMDS